MLLHSCCPLKIKKLKAKSQKLKVNSRKLKVTNQKRRSQKVKIKILIKLVFILILEN